MMRGCILRYQPFRVGRTANVMGRGFNRLKKNLEGYYKLSVGYYGDINAYVFGMDKNGELMNYVTTRSSAAKHRSEERANQSRSCARR